MQALDHKRASALGLKIYQGSIINPGTVSVDSDIVPSDQHWLVTALTAWFSSNNALGSSQIVPPFSGIFLCPQGTPAIPNTDENPSNMTTGNVLAPSIASLAARPLQLLAAQITNSNQGGTFGKTNGMTGAYLNFPDVIIVPANFFLRAAFTLVQTGSNFVAGDVCKLSFLAIQEPNCK